jgi:hypothetical protein
MKELLPTLLPTRRELAWMLGTILVLVLAACVGLVLLDGD